MVDLPRQVCLATSGKLVNFGDSFSSVISIFHLQVVLYRCYKCLSLLLLSRNIAFASKGDFIEFSDPLIHVFCH